MSSPWQLAFQRFKKNKLALAGGCLFIVVLLFISIGPLFTPHEINTIDITKRYHAPSGAHWFGTDRIGQDIMARMMYGGRISMALALASTGVTVLFGTLIGAIAGYKGKWIDQMFMRMTEFVQVLPMLPLIIAFSAIFGFRYSSEVRITATMLVYGFLNFPSLARIVRAQVRLCQSQEYMTAAHLLGLTHASKIFKHLIPNVLGIVIASLSGIIASAILLELALSFVGLGFPPPTPTWGNMIPSIRGANSISGASYWVWFYPVSFISMTIISINLLGEGLREALDPKSEGK